MSEIDGKDEKCIKGKVFEDSFGTIDLANKEAKEEHFGEIAQYEEARVKEAQRKFHARMTQYEREEATRWIGYYRYMVVDADEK
jgi:hypothetical protein